ncbi:LamG-like jellyroll fold domain-containing protein, partial [Anaerohalosphaeraceae bacterium U12dextr]
MFSSFQDDHVQYLSQTGQPQIPWTLFTVLLPPNADLSSVTGQVLSIQYESLGNGWTVPPMPPAATRDEQNNEIVVWPADKTIVDGKDIEIYQSNTFWPYEECRVVQSSQLRQWQLAEIAVPLVRYNPVTGELLKLQSSEVNIDYKRKVQPARIGRLKHDRRGRDRVGHLAVNFSDALAEYEAAAAGTDSSGLTTYATSESSLDAAQAGVNSTGYAIITTNTLKNNSTKLASFITHKQNRGFTVYVVTETLCTCTNTGVTSDGWGGGTGSTSAVNIRTWLKNNYLSKDLLYVLLIGNPNPDSGNVAMFKNSYATSEDDWAPTDYNFWFLDSDSESDRYWEVIVGRIPNYDSSVTYLDSILQKTMDYENSTDTNWRRNVLLPMVPLDSSTPCYQLGEEIKKNLLEPRVIPSYRIYEDNYDALPPPEALLAGTSPAKAWASERYGLVSWQTHGNQDFAASVISSSDASTLNNTYPAVTWQGSCLNAYPENSNNLAYRLLRQGAVVTHAATRNSWYYVGEKSFTNTTSNGGFAYKFADRILRGDTCGVALGTVRQTLTPGLWSNFTRYVIYGDPSVRLFYDMTNFTVAPTDAFYAMKTMGQTPSAVSRTYTIKNNTSSALTWTATETTDWFDLSPTSGTLAAGGSATVTVSINAAAADTLPAGLNSGSILFTDTTNNIAYTRAVQLDVTTTLIGHWRFDDITGSLASDSGPLSNSGTLSDTDIDDTSLDPDSTVDNDTDNAMSFDLNSTAGTLGSALMFDGMGDHIKLNKSVITPGPGFSVCLWAYPTAVKSWARFIDFGNGSSANNLLLARYSSTNDLVFESYNGSSSGGIVRATNAIELNQWQFFAATLDASGNVKLYKNGVLVKSGTSAAPTKVNRTQCYIGRSNWSSDAYYQGSMDDIRIFNTVLTQQQIQNLMVGLTEAYAPKPAEHSSASQQTMLQWSGGENAVGYQIYMGTDRTAVTGATPASAEYMGYRTIPQFNPGELTLGERYFWRVDTITSDGSLLTGPVWDFTAAGSLTRQVYTGISGEAVSNLTSAAKYPNSPDIYEYINSFEGPTNVMDYYGTRLEGYLTPKTSGTYYFYISGDDGIELWFSPNSSPSSSSRIAYSTAYTGVREWTKYASQKSSAKTLVAGQKYYIRALQKEHAGGDHIAVGWQGPDSPSISVIDGQ